LREGEERKAEVERHRKAEEEERLRKEEERLKKKRKCDYGERQKNVRLGWLGKRKGNLGNKKQGDSRGIVGIGKPSRSRRRLPGGGGTQGQGSAQQIERWFHLRSDHLVGE
jgi:hypothetical protein